MTTADELNFDERDSRESYMIVQDYGLNIPSGSTSINDGDSASLQLDGEDITVEDVSYDEESDTYSGIISGFYPSVGVSFGELRLNDEISFREDHIFSVTRNGEA